MNDQKLKPWNSLSPGLKLAEQTRTLGVTLVGIAYKLEHASPLAECWAAIWATLQKYTKEARHTLSGEPHANKTGDLES